MFRSLMLVLAFVLSLVLAGCQSYQSGLVQSAARADEAVVLSNLRSIMTAENAYNSSTGGYGTFEELASGGYLDARFKGERPSLNEYSYSIALTGNSPTTPATSYTCNADPERTGDRAGRHFYIDSTANDIRVNATRAATAGDEIIKP